jgi:hypothetical protein
VCVYPSNSNAMSQSGPEFSAEKQSNNVEGITSRVMPWQIPGH